VLRQAGVSRNALLLEAATTVGDLRLLEPGNAQVFRGDAPSDPVYAVFVYRAPSVPTGVSVHPDTYTSRVLLDKHGTELLVVTWVTGTKPLPTEPFGTRFDALLD